MIKESKVEILFDDIRGYINNLESIIKNKEKEIDIKNRRIKVLEEKENIKINSKHISSLEDGTITLDKSLFDIKSIYYLLGQALKLKSTEDIALLFSLIKKEEVIKLTEKSNKLLIDSLCFYNIYSFENIDKKQVFIVNSLEKLNPEKFEGFYRKIFNELISSQNVQSFINEDFLIKFIRKTAFSENKDIAKRIINNILSSERVITGESNIQNIMLIGLYLGIEQVRKVSYIEPLYIKAMDSRYDNLFINFLIGKIKLDFSQLDNNIINIKVLNKNLVRYIYSIAKENDRDQSQFFESKLFKTSLLKEHPVKKESVSKDATKVVKKESAKRGILKEILVNKNTRVCDIDNGLLRYSGQSLNYYDSQMNKVMGEVLENILVCTTCKRKMVNGDVIRKIYKKIPHSYRLKFKNQNDINLSTFKYNIGLPRSERTKLLKEVICPAMGVENVIKALNKLIDAHRVSRVKDYSLSIIEWEHDIKKLRAYYDV
ncbi:MAG: hypothetical protein ACRCTZ_03210 [Sarcina sp.]